MASTRAELRSDRVGKIILVLLFCGGIPFFVMHGEWARVALKIYALTVGVFFVVVSAYWESIRQLWFWKAMALLAVIHVFVALALVEINLNLPQIDRLPRAAYAGLAWVAVGETAMALFIVRRFRARRHR